VPLVLRRPSGITDAGLAAAAPRARAEAGVGRDLPMCQVNSAAAVEGEAGGVHGGSASLRGQRAQRSK